jgi:hypothetical protein
MFVQSAIRGPSGRTLVHIAKTAEPTEGVWEIHAGVPRAKKSVPKIGPVEDLH